MTILSVHDVSVSFGGLRALDAVSLEVEAGTMVGLIGPNGAGKTTLIGVLSGLQRPNQGSVDFDGHDLLKTPPQRRVQFGMTRTFQRLELWDSMSVFDNVRTAAELAAKWRTEFDPLEATNSAIDLFGLGDMAQRSIGSLSTGTARLVEVARALASRPKMMLLDEPSAGLDRTESVQFGRVLAGVVAEANTAILLVEHHVDMVFEHCSKVYVLDFGRVIAAGAPLEVQNDERVKRAYLGGLVGTATELRGIDAAYGTIKVLFSVDIVVPEGGVVALLGPNGAGKSTTLRVASGLMAPRAGTVHLGGLDVTQAGPRRRAQQGVCLVPEGRGVFPNLTVRENLLLHTYVRPSASAADLEQMTYERFPVLGQRRKQVAGTLSGGEQQMLALSRALTSAPSLLLLDEISMGLAPLLVEELFGVIKDEVAKRAVSVLIVEQLAEFALNIADRAVVLARGTVVATGTPEDVKQVLAEAYLGSEDIDSGWCLEA